jgi:hypothetical protein
MMDDFQLLTLSEKTFGEDSYSGLRQNHYPISYTLWRNETTGKLLKYRFAHDKLANIG